MKAKEKDSVEKRFPSSFARSVADQAIDKLAESESMETYIDTWMGEYLKAGGRYGSLWVKK